MRLIEVRIRPGGVREARTLGEGDGADAAARDERRRAVYRRFARIHAMQRNRDDLERCDLGGEG